MCLSYLLALGLPVLLVFLEPLKKRRWGTLPARAQVVKTVPVNAMAVFALVVGYAQINSHENASGSLPVHMHLYIHMYVE